MTTSLLDLPAKRRRSRKPLAPIRPAQRRAFGEFVYSLGLWETWLRQGRARPVVHIPEDAITGSGSGADDMFQGRFAILGHVLHSLNRPPWDAAAPNPVLLAELHAFEWLRDFRAAGGPAARKHGCDLVRAWALRFGRWQALAWRPDVLGRRLGAWTAAADFLLADVDPVFARDFHSLIMRQTRHLKAALRGTPEGAARIEAAAGLAVAATGVGAARWRHRGFKVLEDECEAHILPDGGPRSRNPQDAVRILTALVQVRAAQAGAQLELPHWVQQAIDRTGPFVRGLRHGDGALGVFNGGYEGEGEAIEALLRATDGSRAPQMSAPESGFERLAAERTLIIADTGIGPGAEGHRGPLAFEMSVGKDRLVVNCGTFAGTDADWYAACRATAAHSTAVIGETNAAPAGEDTAPVILRGREDGAGWVELPGTAYRARFGLEHRRRLSLADDGQEVRGEDRLTLPPITATKTDAAATTFTVRFHLHPQIQASLMGTAEEVLLRLPNGAGWTFEAPGRHLRLEESIYLGRPGEMRRTRQIVLDVPLGSSGGAASWRFARLQGAAKGSSV